jgi:hypothetical protein
MTEVMIIELEKNNVLYDKSRKDYKDIVKKETFGNRLQMTKFYHSKQEKNESPRKPPTVFRVWVRTQVEWQNCSKVAFMFALNTFAFALCINGP